MVAGETDVLLVQVSQNAHISEKKIVADHSFPQYPRLFIEVNHEMRHGLLPYSSVSKDKATPARTSGAMSCKSIYIVENGYSHGIYIVQCISDNWYSCQSNWLAKADFDCAHNEACDFSPSLVLYKYFEHLKITDCG